MPIRLHPKLSARYYGSFLVLRQVGLIDFGLQLPTTTRIHPIFYVSQLKRVMGAHQVEREFPEKLQGRTSVCLPDRVLDRKIEQQPRQEEPTYQVLI